jgi:hypothetical protein
MDTIVDPFKLERPDPTNRASASGITDPFKDRPLPGAVSDLVNARPTPTASPSNISASDIPKEIAAGAVQGTGAVVSGIGDFGRMVARPIVSTINDATGSQISDPVNPFATPAKAITDFGTRIAESESPAAKAAKEKDVVTGDLTDPSSLKLGEGAKSPSTLAMKGAGLLGQIAPLLAGGLEGRALKLAPDVVKALPGIAAKLEQGAALTEAEHAIATTAAKAASSASARATATGAGIGGLQGAEGAAEAERDRITNMSDEDLAAVPGYSDRIGNGMTPAQARADLADAAGRGAFAATLPVATVAGAVSTAPLLHEAQGALAKVAGEGAVRRAAVGAAAEAPLQAGLSVGQGAAETAGANAETGEDRSLTENSASEAATGAALGAAFGAAGGAATRPHAAPRFPDAQPGTLADAANAVPVGEGKREAASDAREPFTPPPAEAAEPGSLSEAVETLTPRSAPSVPWIDQSSGEFRRPTDEEVKDAFHAMFAAASDAGAGMQSTAASRMLSEEWGVPRDRLQVLRKDALAERNEGFQPGDKRAAPKDENAGDLTPPSGELFPEGDNASAKPASAKDAALDESLPDRGSGNADTSGDLGNAVPTQEQAAGESKVPPVRSVSEVPRQESAAGEGVSNARVGDTEPGGDRVEAQPVGTKANGDVETPAVRTDHQVGSDVRGLGGEDKVAGNVVKPVPVDVVHDLASEKGPSEKALHDESVLKPLPSDAVDHNADEPVAGVVPGKAADVPASAGSPHENASESKPTIADDTANASSKVETAALDAAAHPKNDGSTAAQQAANNAKAGHVDLHGLDVTIQVPKGGLRKGVDAKGNAWERPASDHYGHIRATEAADGEQHDVYLGPHAESPDAKVFVIDQVKPGTKIFDETKSMVGYTNGKAARTSYQKNFPKGMSTFGGIREMSIGEFKDWVRSDASKKPVTDKVRTADKLPPAQKGVRESKAVLADRAKVRAGEITAPAPAHVGGETPESRLQRALLRALNDGGNLKSITKEQRDWLAKNEFASGRGKSLAITDAGRAELDRLSGAVLDHDVKTVQQRISARDRANEDAAGGAVSDELARIAGKAKGEFRQGADESITASPKLDEIKSAVREVTDKWGPEAPSVRVVDSPEHLPAAAKDNPRYQTARGFYDGQNAYIVASNHADVASALRSVAHEVVGHYGVDRIVDEFGKGGMDQLVADINRLRDEGLGSAAMKSVLEDVAKRYPNADAREFAREVVAVMAERGVRNGVLGRVIAAAKALLRKLFPNMTFSENDIRAMLARSEQYLHEGPTLADRQELVRSLAFDQPAEAAGLTPGERNNPNKVAEAARSWREQGTDSPYFQKFFEGSKVTHDGKPQIVYHGTASDHTVFKDTALGEATGHSTSPLGHFFSEDRALAERYAENASEGVPADERVVDAYLAIKKPYEMKLAEAQRIESQAEARALKEKLRRQGYDGIRIPEAKSWIAFDSEQIKSTENRGTFDPKHGDINFSLPEASMDTLDEVLSKPDDSVWQRAKDWARGKSEDFRPAALGALQTRHVLELMENHPALKGASQYGEHMQALASDRNQLLTGSPDAAEHPENMLKRGGATISQDLRDFTFEKGPAGWFGRRTEASKNLASVMHGATIYGLDPSQPYQRLTYEDSRGGSVEWTQKGIKERIKEIRGQMRGRPGDDKSMMMDEVKRIRNIPKRENLRQQRWPDLVAQYQALPEKAKELYKQQRDFHSQMRDETEKALIKRIEALGQDVGANYVRSLQDRIRLQFEAQRREGVYFPLDRNGEYWTSFTDKDGQQGFKMFESAKDADQAEKKLRAAGFTVNAQGRRDSTYRAKDAPSGTFVKDIVQLLKKAGASEKVQDDVYQTFLKTLPEMSMRKHSIHRRNIPGYSEDVLRSFAKNAFHGAHQLARLRYAHEMQSTVEAMQASLDNYRRGGDFGEASATSALDVARGDALLSELKKRHDFIMAPKEAQLANVANSIGFIYYLGASPASAIVNLTQNAQVTLPVLAAQHGWGKASRMLGGAIRDSLRTFGNIDRTLKTEDERQAYNVMRARGDIDKTQSHTLAGLAEGSLLTTNPVWAKTMSAMTYMFHKAEVVNREAAGMAAYRLARSRGDDFNTAIKYASDIVNGTHFDYSAANRPRIMQNNAARVALQFKNYSVGMTWALYRNLYQAFKGETPEVRTIARRTLTGMLGVTAVMAGAMGLPMINAVRFAGNAAHTLFGDDEPFDFDTEFRAWLAEHLGEDASKWVADGAVNRLGGNVSQRVSLSDLWFREPDKELEGKDAYYAMLESLAGPMGGLAKNFFVGSKMVGEGNVERGIETMMPKFAKDAMKATRFAHDGANTLRGDPILPDVTTPESFIQLLGFQPTRLAEQQRTNNAMKNYEQGILDRRATLLNTLAMATRGGDDDERAGVLKQIHAFNEQFPEIALKSDSIRQSMRARARYSAQSEGGVFINKKLAPRLRADVQGEASP